MKLVVLILGTRLTCHADTHCQIGTTDLKPVYTVQVDFREKHVCYDEDRHRHVLQRWFFRGTLEAFAFSGSI
jgi:hypothetical protein